ncbi:MULTISPECIES: hypothetical protein [Actinomadura]|uniref:Uncharacterized protein n=1 Tax=Actinomadura litoris TaxID=2678616 RepID=A0A7K1KY08_9ACTN|nr:MULTISPECIES: hypothetical protein [Actinomadura]MBT2209096.1 hypothetical protein [Actinomadura sp. NEAU-AAG7]MUN37088.1 hypothetical protein [Actinomadura litoris]
MGNDTPRSAPPPDGRAVAWLRDVVRALEVVGGFKLSLHRPYGEAGPFLDVVGDEGPRLAEVIRVRREGAGLRGVWSWGEDIEGDGDPQVAAKAIGKVVRPRM